AAEGAGFCGSSFGAAAGATTCTAGAFGSAAGYLIAGPFEALLGAGAICSSPGSATAALVFDFDLAFAFPFLPFLALGCGIRSSPLAFFCASDCVGAPI